mgnify:CR=1 FL=1
MTDLPYAQPIFNDNPKSDNSKSDDKVGSSFLEKPPVESSFSSEKIPTPENITSPENLPVPKPEIQQTPETSTDTIAQANKERVEKVVDKTSEITTLHDIKPTKDKLTIEADEEEERFIEEVEKHHGKL